MLTVLLHDSDRRKEAEPRVCPSTQSTTPGGALPAHWFIVEVSTPAWEGQAVCSNTPMKSSPASRTQTKRPNIADVTVLVAVDVMLLLPEVVCEDDAEDDPLEDTVADAEVVPVLDIEDVAVLVADALILDDCDRETDVLPVVVRLLV